MAKSSMQKQKLLYLRKILLEKTDENHPMTFSEIKEALAAYGIRTERKSFYDDLEILESFGMDICSVRSNTVRYFAGSREFEIAELKLLVDAIQSSKFITRSKSLRLIEKLEGLVSENEGKLLHREVVVTNRVKTLNEQIYYNVDFLHNAMAEIKRSSAQSEKTAKAMSFRRGRCAGMMKTTISWHMTAPQARSSTTASIRWKRSFCSATAATERRSLKSSTRLAMPKACFRCSAARSATSSFPSKITLSA